MVKLTLNKRTGYIELNYDGKIDILFTDLEELDSFSSELVDARNEFVENQEEDDDAPVT